MRCAGCNAEIDASVYIKCSQETCKKLYHLNCIALTKEKFEAYSEEYKRKWMCPECLRDIPRGDNSNTPVRGNTMMAKHFTPSTNVNTERGNRLKTKDIPVIPNESMVLEELRLFRLEMESRLDEQKKEYFLLQNRFVKTDTELREIRKIMEVIQEKANKVDDLEKNVKTLIKRNEHLEARLMAEAPTKQNNATAQVSKELPPSFVNAVKQGRKKVVSNNDSIERVATKPANAATYVERAPAVNKDKIVAKSVDIILENGNREPENEGNWETVKRKTNRYPNSEVKRGGSTSVFEIQGEERKKYLHVWRLQKSTTVDKLENYVKNICGKDIVVKVEKIKPKTERDYSSFIIGVPERKYDILCQPENWPINIEFCEWVWFRRYIDKQKKPH